MALGMHLEVGMRKAVSPGMWSAGSESDHIRRNLSRFAFNTYSIFTVNSGIPPLSTSPLRMCYWNWSILSFFTVLTSARCIKGMRAMRKCRLTCSPVKICSQSRFELLSSLSPSSRSPFPRPSHSLWNLRVYSKFIPIIYCSFLLQVQRRSILLNISKSLRRSPTLATKPSRFSMIPVDPWTSFQPILLWSLMRKALNLHSWVSSWSTFRRSRPL